MADQPGNSRRTLITSVPLGNPHAKKQIAAVNAVKKDYAYLYALMLEPVINAKAGLSQRKMVEYLNNEGIHAHEGGNWVLSQYQKVLHRIHLLQTVFELQQKHQRWEQLPTEQQLQTLKQIVPKNKWHRHNKSSNEVLEAHAHLTRIEQLISMSPHDEARAEINKLQQVFFATPVYEQFPPTRAILNRINAWVREHATTPKPLPKGL